MEAKRLLDTIDYESMKIYLADAFVAVHKADMPARDCEKEDVQLVDLHALNGGKENVCNMLVILDSIVEEEHKQFIDKVSATATKRNG